MQGLLVIMGSGETAPTMVKAHRAVFERVRADAPAILLDTPYGFQVNADAISATTAAGISVGRGVVIAAIVVGRSWSACTRERRDPDRDRSGRPHRGAR